MDHDAATCLNCGAHPAGPYCQGCGQSTHIHRTLTAWWHDLSHGVLHVEGAVWHTLALLLRAPGQLTRRYIDGQRRRFIAPLPLFLFSAFLLYIVFALFGGLHHINIDDNAHINAPAETVTRLQQVDADIARARQDAGAVAHNGNPDADLAELQRQRDELLHRQAQFKGGVVGLPAVADDELRRHPTGSATLDEGLRRAARDPDFLFFKLEANGYKFSWLLIPLSAPLLWPLFARRRGVFIFDHTVFVTYSLSFVTLLMAVMILWHRAHLPGSRYLWLAFPIHLFFQLRGGYRLSIWGTLWREVVVLLAAAIALLAWIVLLLGLDLIE